MDLLFKTARFTASSLLPEEYPQLKTPQGTPLPEIALVGRSNVGKSSLINALLHQKKLAKTSSIPGKTQRINFFLIDEKLLLADLPGYGFAKAPASLSIEWSQAIHTYFQTRTSLKLVFLLIDSRRGPSKEDWQVIEWGKNQSFSLIVILTKIDKLSPSELQLALAQAKTHFEAFLPFSIHDKLSKHQLKRLIQSRIHS
ncbi:MAG: ribosome biogenesis GTP-binding protein YihA/YsxC [Chlamydiales bacterium]|nr:ribosome biogenesis GTP-binding protein YihA/YsxC [Chlamydiales bacterium]